uniref:Telethonin n=1 Tax=Sphenodon punctatus TaxID=8508 RepID=A0A8D0GIJ4_SPHPU
AAAELSCLVTEQNTAHKESFMAEWKDLSLSTRPEEGCSRSEVDTRRKETFRQQQETRIVVQRSPWGFLRLGRLGEPLRSYPLPYQRALPLPIFAPADLSAKAEREPSPSPTALTGADRKDLAELTRELPPLTQPRKAGLPRSLSRSISQEAQRG